MKTKQTIMIVYIACLLAMFACGVQGAFSTPYLPDQTLVLNGTNSYQYDIVFQNTNEEPAEMKLTILQGQEWVEPDELTVNVQGKQYDAQGHFTVRIPKEIIVNGEPQKIEHNKPYTITYVVSSGDIAGNGMVPVTSQVKKTFYVLVPEESWPLTTWLAIGCVIIVILALIGYVVFKNKNEPDNENEQNQESNG